jgi:hypothetical protein
MAFQDELKDGLLDSVSQLIPEDKKEEVQAELLGKLSPTLEKLTKVLTDQSNDIAAFKKKAKELEIQLREKSGSTPPAPTGIDPDEYRRVQADLEVKEQALSELATKHSTTERERKELEKLVKMASDKLERESSFLNATVKETELRKAIGNLSLKEPEMADEVFNILLPNVKVSIDEKTGARKTSARLKDDTGIDADVPLLDYVKSWAEKSLVAKSLLAAPRTSGSGAQGAYSAGSIGGPKGIEQLYEEAVARAKSGDQRAISEVIALQAKMQAAKR